MMVEPTETESKETLDAFAEALHQVAREAATDPDLLHEAPVTTPVRRLDEARAARDLRLTWSMAGASAGAVGRASAALAGEEPTA